jgi:hypothetical protein
MLIRHQIERLLVAQVWMNNGCANTLRMLYDRNNKNREGNVTHRSQSIGKQARRRTALPKLHRDDWSHYRTTFQPLGFDWKMAVALQAGLAAKEVVVSTLGVLYSLGSDANAQDSSLAHVIHDQIPLPSAVAFIVVIMTYLPCLAASVVFTREAGGIKYFGYLFVLTTIVAYSLAFVAYHLTVYSLSVTISV